MSKMRIRELEDNATTGEIENTFRTQYKEQKEDLEKQYSSTIEKHLKNIKHEMEEKLLISNNKIAQLQNELKNKKDNFEKYEHELATMYKLIKKISSDKVKNNSLLFQRELDEKLTKENLPLL